MARPRKPTAQLKLVGAFEKDPQRKRDSEPVCTEPVGPAPARLTEYQVEAWNYLVDSAVDGVLTRMDRAYLELVSIALSNVWYWNEVMATENKDGETVAARPMVISTLQTVGFMLGKLGMTPSDRSQVVVPKDPGGGGGQRRTR